MKARVFNDGDKPIQVTVDRDTTNASTIEPGEEAELESNGVIELHEQGTHSGTGTGSVGEQPPEEIYRGS